MNHESHDGLRRTAFIFAWQRVYHFLNAVRHNPSLALSFWSSVWPRFSSLLMAGRIPSMPIRRPACLPCLREDLDLTGSKYGCGEGMCGACTVLIDGKAQRSCVTRVGSVAQKKITTIEGLANGDRLHPVQQAFLDAGALQCGYCTSGMIMSAVALLQKNPNPQRKRNYRFHGWQRLPVRDVSAHCERDSESGEDEPDCRRRKEAADERHTLSRRFRWSRSGTNCGRRLRTDSIWTGGISSSSSARECWWFPFEACRLSRRNRAAERRGGEMLCRKKIDAWLHIGENGNGHRLYGQSRSRTEHTDVSDPGRGGRTPRADGEDRAGHGRYAAHAI